MINIIELGLHYTEEGQEIMTRILAQMNNNRLSTVNKWTEEDRTRLLSDISLLISKGSNYYFSGGKTFIKSLNRRLSTNKKVAVQVIAKDSGVVIKAFSSVSECGKFLGINVQTLHYKIKNNSYFHSSTLNQTVCVKREEN